MQDTVTLTATDVEYAAEWRRQKAAEYPHDADRNLEAAGTLDRIAAELPKYDGSELHRRVQAVCNRNPDRFSETLSQLIQAVGFRSSASNAAEFLGELLLLLEF